MVGEEAVLTLDVGNLSQLCRVCLQMPEDGGGGGVQQFLDLTTIYDEDDQLTYAECFTICTQINLSAPSDENLPSNLCKSCGLELQMAYDFHKKVEESKRVLRMVIEGRTTTQLPAQTAVEDDPDEPRPDGETEGEDALTLPDMAVERLDGSEANFEMTEELIPLEDFEEADEDEDEGTVLGQRECQGDAQDAAAKRMSPVTPAECAAERALAKFTRSPRPAGRTRFPCDVCQKVFVHRSRMELHRRMHEADRPRYPCPNIDCSRAYISKQACETHFKQAHLVEGLSCHICDKRFAIRQTLEVHMRYHEGVFPYACDQCDKRFAQKGHLTTHKNVKHNNYRYVCTEPECSKVFESSMAFRNHRFLHIGMPFKCAFCEKGFPQKSKLRVHLSLKHNVNFSLEDLEKMRKFRKPRMRHSALTLKPVAQEDASRNTW